MTRLILYILVIVAFMSLGVGCKVMRYNECRTAHPVWYCLSGR